jgi:GNAT superfamily N-acetyltransferase
MATSPSESRRLEFEEITVDSSAPSIKAAQDLLLEYGRWVIVQPGGGHFCFGSLEKEVAQLPASYLNQNGGCLIARVDSIPAGCVAWREMSASVAAKAWELKRLYVRLSARGLALGRALTQAVIDRALKSSRTAVYLDTAPESMAAAHQLYLDLGFIPCERYNDNPVEGLVHLVKFL